MGRSNYNGVGIDYALRNNRLTGAIDYYHTTRENLLFYGPTPAALLLRPTGLPIFQVMFLIPA
jgi:hypothetical protein